MLNLIRMNLYRMTKTKSLYILLLCSALFCLLACYMDRVDYIETQKEEQKLLAEEANQTEGSQTITEEANQIDGSQSITENTSQADGSQSIAKDTDQKENTTGITIKNISEEDEDDPADESFGIMVQTPEKTDGKNPVFLEYFHSYLASGILLIFLVIGSALYVNGEFKCGFIKNIAGQTRHKSYIYIAKIIAMAVYTAFFMLFYGLVDYIGLKLFLPYHLAFGQNDLSQSVKLMAATFLLYTAFTSAIALLVTLTRSTSVGITVGLLACMGFLSLFIPYLEKLFHVKIQKYLIITNMQQMLLDVSGKSIWQGVYVGIAFLLIYLLLGTTYFTKKDVV